VLNQLLTGDTGRTRTLDRRSLRVYDKPATLDERYQTPPVTPRTAADHSDGVWRGGRRQERSIQFDLGPAGWLRWTYFPEPACSSQGEAVYGALERPRSRMRLAEALAPRPARASRIAGQRCL